MSWVKLDDQFTDHPKISEAGPLGGWLYVCGLTYCARYLTDGFIPASRVKLMADIPNIQQVASKLVDLGLWEVADGGYLVHDYLEYNPSSDEARATKEARKRAGRRGGLAKAAKAQQSASKTSSKNVAKTKQKSAPSPSPYIYTTTTTRAREAQTVEQKLESAGMMLNKGILDWLQAKESELKEHIDKLPDRAPGADLTPDDWLRAAIDEAMESAENGRFNLRYLDTILDGWEVRGFRVRPEFVKRKAKGESKGSDAMAEELQARVKVL